MDNLVFLFAGQPLYEYMHMLPQLLSVLKFECLPFLEVIPRVCDNRGYIRAYVYGRWLPLLRYRKPTSYDHCRDTVGKLMEYIHLIIREWSVDYTGKIYLKFPFFLQPLFYPLMLCLVFGFHIPDDLLKFRFVPHAVV